MASLIKQKYYAQFYNTYSTPKQKRIRLGTRTKCTAVKLLRKLEDEYALGEYDPWKDDIIQKNKNEINQYSTFKQAVDLYVQKNQRKIGGQILQRTLNMS